jgi:putative ABC transport system permease protein
MTFQTFPVVYTRYSQALVYNPPERRVLSFVLASPAPGVSVEEACRRITAQTGLKALTREQFKRLTVMYYLVNTGIAINFGLTITLGFVVGVLVAGQVFYLFTLENLPHYAMLKAMGTRDGRIVRMMCLQALLVGAVGYGLGITGPALVVPWAQQFFPVIAFDLRWEVLAGTAVVVLLIVLVFALVSIRKVIRQEPAIVFRG